MLAGSLGKRRARPAGSDDFLANRLGFFLASQEDVLHPYFGVVGQLSLGEGREERRYEKGRQQAQDERLLGQRESHGMSSL